ncbi:hypothetical protein AAC387_Pa03g0919 [Persea americana]
MGELSWKHHTLIQALMSRGPLEEKDFHSIFTGITGKNPGSAQPLFNEYLRKINKELAYVQFELRACRNQYNGKVYYGVVNNVADEQSKLGTKYSVPQIAFYKAVIEVIVHDTTAHGSISSVEALNIRLESQIQTEQGSQGSQSQIPPAFKSFSLSQKETTLNDLVRDRWLCSTSNGKIGLGVRSFLDLRSWFRINEVPSCDICNEAGVKADLCPNEGCNVRIHNYCLKMKFSQKRAARVCPVCGTEWQCPEFTVGEEEEVGVNNPTQCQGPSVDPPMRKRLRSCKAEELDGSGTGPSQTSEPDEAASSSSSSSSSSVDVRLDLEASQQPSQPSPDDDLVRAGLLFANIVDLKCRYMGSLYGPELVTFVREPLNPCDPNAIKVITTRTAQLVGHLERPATAILSPLMDTGFITVEGIIFRQRWCSSKLTCQVHVLTYPDSVDTARFLIDEGEIGFYPRSCPIFGLGEAAILREKLKQQNNDNQIETGTRNYSDDLIFLSGGGGGGGGGTENENENDNDNDNGGNKKRKIVEPPKDVVSTELFLHQKEGLAWLIQRENSCELPLFCEWRDTGVYVNVLTNSRTVERPETLQGGIFADDMGMGKTLTLLSLIAANRRGSLVPPFIEIDRDIVEATLEKLQNNDEEKVTDSDLTESRLVVKSGERVAGSHKKRKIHDFNDYTAEDRVDKLQNHVEEEGTIYNSKKSGVDESGKIALGSCKNRKTEDECDDLGPNTTLIVCPPTVLSTWITQIKEHTTPGSLKVYKYHGKRTSDAAELWRFDIVFTTYTTLSSEKNDPESPIKKIEWWRIILDEAHVIRNVTAQQSQAVMHLKGKKRWLVTGTPIQNGSFDLFAFMTFLRFEPFSIKHYWQRLVQCPLSKGRASGLSRLQALMRMISLQRTKDLQMGNRSLVALPPKTVETCFFELSTEERKQYDHLESQART